MNCMIDLLCLHVHDTKVLYTQSESGLLSWWFVVLTVAEENTNTMHVGLIY